MSTNTHAITNNSLAVLVLILLILSHLALVDINKGIEGNLSAEWWVVRITLSLAALLVVTSLISARYIIRHDSNLDSEY